MKMHINRSSTIVLLTLVCLPTLIFAGKSDDSERKKNINKSYTVTSNDKLSIDNSFGDVMVSTWDKNEIQVNIEIETEASTDEKAERMMDEISVSDDRSGNLISFKTTVEQMNDHGNHSKGNKSFHINYTIMMPADNPLEIVNQFGKIKMGDRKGEVNLTSKFGGLTTGNLENVGDIDVEFGEASLGNVHNGKVTFKFDGKSHIDRVSGIVKINSEFSGNVQFSVDNNIDELSVNESYSTVKMIVSNNLSAHFEVHTSFGSFNNHTEYMIKEDKDDDEDSGPKFDKDYSGKAGDGKSKIKIKSSFGKVSMTHAGNKDEDEDNDNDSEKHSSKKDKVKV
jgi:hypothetical protein